MPDNRPHFEIPRERVQNQPIQTRGRAKPFTRPNFSAHADFLRERTARLEAYSSTTADAEATDALFLQVITLPELPARGERQRLHNAGLEIVALSSVNPNSVTVQISKSDLPTLRAKVNLYADTPDNRGKSYMGIIDDIGPVPIEEKLAPQVAAAVDDTPIDCLLIFYASLTEGERAAILFAVRSFMSRNGLSIGSERRLSNGVTFVEARLRPSEARAAGAAFSTLKQITPNNLFFIPDGRRISNISPAVSVGRVQGATSVAVIDSGVSPACEAVARAVIATIPQLPPGAIQGELGHGTFVASRVVYGDDLERSLQSGTLTPSCPIVDVPVVGVNNRGDLVPVHEGHLAAAIDNVIPQLPATTRVVNLSLGTNAPAVDGQMSLVAQIIDKHVRDSDLLAITTAGNIRDPRLLQQFPNAHLLPASRIDPPGDSLLALTIGSIAKFLDTGSLSRARELSAFSRRGPGPFGGCKPDLVAHGGNCLVDGSTTGRMGVHGLAASGAAYECDCGTSFAAPLVSSMGAVLFDHYGNPSATLIRGLLLHFTTPVVTPAIACQPEHLTGLGEPNLDAARWAGAHSAAFLHTGELTTDRYSFLPFFVPSLLAAGGSGRLQIKVTVVISPPVSPDNQLEYAKARVTLALRKPVEVGHRPVGVSADLVDVDNWSPLSQLTHSFNRSYETGEWQLQLRLWARGVASGFRQSFAAIVEVVDETGSLPVRSAVEAEAGALFPIMTVRAAA